MTTDALGNAVESETDRRAAVPSMDDEATTKRALLVRRKMNESLTARTPQERDRIMQVHLAQARGASANAYLLRCAMNFALRLRSRRT